MLSNQLQPAEPAYMCGMSPVLSRPSCTCPPCQKSQNIGVNKNLGACQEFTVFGQSISLIPDVISKIRKNKKCSLYCPNSVFLLFTSDQRHHKDPPLDLKTCSNWILWGGGPASTSKGVGCSGTSLSGQVRVGYACKQRVRT
jgi:hypothetical protein